MSAESTSVVLGAERPHSAAPLLRTREYFHNARAELFLRLLRPRPGARLLDLGGSTGDLAERITRRVPLDVTVADVETAHAAAVARRGFRHLRLPESGP
ncbi:MAG TPA: hypothetical protein VF832_06600, partial [Longimicrobiales bacterium]